MGILGVVTCIVVTLSAATLWVHQVALNTDRYVAVVSRVAANPQVVEELSGQLADRVVDEFDVPRLVKPLIRDWIQKQIGAFMGSDVFVDGWAAANRVAHTALVRVLRGDSVLNSSDGELSIKVLPVIIVGLHRLMDVGILPDDLELPDPSDVDAGDVVRRVLEERLGINLPPDFDEMPLVRMSRLESVRQLVRVFDLITVAGILLAAALVGLFVWLSRNRLRAVIVLGLGTAATALIAQILIVSGGRLAANAVSEDGSRETIAALIEALLGNLAGALTLVLILGVAAAAGAAFVGRRSAPRPVGESSGVTAISGSAAEPRLPSKAEPPESDEPAPPAKPARRARKKTG
jgi:chromate transport protein ChrA